MYPFHAWYKLPVSPIDIVALKNSCRNFIFYGTKAHITLHFYQNDFGSYFPRGRSPFPNIPVSVDVYENGAASILCIGADQQIALHNYFMSLINTKTCNLSYTTEKPCSCNHCTYSFRIEPCADGVIPPQCTHPRIPTLPAFMLFLELVFSKLLDLLSMRLPSVMKSKATTSREHPRHPLFDCTSLRIVSYRSIIKQSNILYHLLKPLSGIHLHRQDLSASSMNFPMSVCTSVDGKNLSSAIKEALRENLTVVKGSIIHNQDDNLIQFSIVPVQRRNRASRPIFLNFAGLCKSLASAENRIDGLPACYRDEGLTLSSPQPLCAVHFTVSQCICVTSRCPHALLSAVKMCSAHFASL